MQVAVFPGGFAGQSTAATRVVLTHNLAKMELANLATGNSRLLNLEVQISREAALLGGYDTALLYYEGVMKTIQTWAWLAN